MADPTAFTVGSEWIDEEGRRVKIWRVKACWIDWECPDGIGYTKIDFAARRWCPADSGPLPLPPRVRAAAEPTWPAWRTVTETEPAQCQDVLLGWAGLPDTYIYIGSRRSGGGEEAYRWGDCCGEVSDDFRRLLDRRGDPTHWMPLPPAPAGPAGESEPL